MCGCSTITKISTEHEYPCYRSQRTVGQYFALGHRTECRPYIFTDVAELDITDVAAIERMVTMDSIGIIINCAAYTNVDKAEDDREQAERINATAVAYLAAVMKRHDGWLIHVSTDYVFGGGLYNTPCKEDRQGKPTGVCKI